MGLLSDIGIILLVFFLLFLWFITGIDMAGASTDLSKYTKQDKKIASAQTNAFWGAFVTFTLLALGIILIITFVVLIIFFPEVFLVFGAEGAADVAVEATVEEGTELGAELATEAAEEAVEEGENLGEKALKKGVKKTVEKKKPKKSKRSWIQDIVYGFLFVAMGLLIFNGILAVLCAIDIDESTMKSQVHRAYRDAVDAAVISFTTVGLIIIFYILEQWWVKHRAAEKQESLAEKEVQTQEKAQEKQEEKEEDKKEKAEEKELKKEGYSVADIKKYTDNMRLTFKNNLTTSATNYANNLATSIPSYNSVVNSVNNLNQSYNNTVQSAQAALNQGKSIYKSANNALSSVTSTASSIGSSFSSLTKKLL